MAEDPLKILKKLSTPQKVQDYLDSLPFNFEKRGETYHSPVKVVEAGEAHCFEGACLAVACLHLNKIKSYLLDLKVDPRFHKKDVDHVVAVFKQSGRWGAISKTNHSVLRWRDPIYKTVRELALSYFHEYFLLDGRKSLISFSSPFDIFEMFNEEWMTSDRNLDEIVEKLEKSRHTRFFSPAQTKFLRKASRVEVKASDIVEWKQSSRRGIKGK